MMVEDALFVQRKRPVRGQGGQGNGEMKMTKAQDSCGRKYSGIHCFVQWEYTKKS